MSSANAQLASTAISTALAIGARDFVICAGARNAPLIADLGSRKGLRLWNHFDERSASFFALGLAKASRRPAAVVTTSGTAAAELLPAMVEGWYSGIPLLAVTADRPASFRGSGAPQAIEQGAIFENYAGVMIEFGGSAPAPDSTSWDGISPVHFNVCLEEPDPQPVAKEESAIPVSLEKRELERAVPADLDWEKCIVVAGEIVSERERRMVREFLLASSCPVWLEATSGLRDESALLDIQILDESEIDLSEIRAVIRVGGVPSGRFWRDLEEREEIRVINFTRTGFRGLGRRTNVLSCEFSKITDLTGYGPQSNRVRFERKKSPFSDRNGAELDMVRQLSRWIPETAGVFLGNSLPIREWNLAADRSVSHPHCFANRGANGIDGELSTFLGVSDRYDETWGIFGDLTTLYDLNAPWWLQQLNPKKRIRIVVLNNGGGRIFSRLPALKNLVPELKKRTENEHSIDFSGWAAMWGLDYIRCAGGDSQKSPNLENRSHCVIEVEI